MSEIHQYIAIRLSDLGIDGEALVDIFQHYLEGAGEEEEMVSSLSDHYGLDLLAVQQVVQELTVAFERGYLLPHERERLYQVQAAPPGLAPPPPPGLAAARAPAVGQAEGEEVEPYDYYDDYEEDPTGGMDLLTLLEGLQPSFSAAAIAQAFALTGWHYPQACALLAIAAEKVNSCKPCRHLLSSGCYRKDCPFQHQLKDFPCRYWLFQNCQDTSEGGAHCAFSHDISPLVADLPPPPEHSVQGAGMESEVFEEVDEVEAFPALGSSSSAGKTAKTPAGGGGDYLRALNNNEKKAQSRQQVAWTNRDMTYASSAAAQGSSKGRNDKPAVPREEWVDKAGFAQILEEMHFVLPRNAKATASSTTSSSTGVSTGGGKEYKVQVGEWVESGDSLFVEYSALREEATRLSSSRVRLFQEAALAYGHGSREIARRLSLQARNVSQAMQTCQLEAGKTIFRRRNTLAALQQGTMDLHGLHVSEARSCLLELVPLYRRLGLSLIKVVTGTGHHSVHGHARLLPSVQAFFKELGYSTKPVKDNSGYTGALVVRLS
eukprot:gene10437-11560_t